MPSKPEHYLPLSTADNGAVDADTSIYGSNIQHPRQAPGRGRRLRIGIWVSLALLISVGFWGYGYRPIRCSSAFRPNSDLQNAAPTVPSLGLKKKIQQGWGPYSPYFPSAKYSTPPVNCDIIQVNLLQRHGARYPTAKASEDIQKSVKKLRKAKHHKHKSVKFLENYKWNLGQDDLVPFGAAQSFEAGWVHFKRYEHLIDEGNLPFVRASGADRVIMSALNWTAGFAAANKQVYTPKLSVIISETANDTLDNAMCPACERSVVDADAWRAKFTVPIEHRLKKTLPGVKLSPSDITNIMSLCAFETVAYEEPSPFCGMFTTHEFQSYEHDEGLKKYYYTGYGNEFGRVQGVGYVNELLARLTGTPVDDHTQTNSTLDLSPETFPLNRTFYADFSHDNTMVAIYGALGLFPQKQAPSNSKIEHHRTWRMSRLVPFSSRMTTEKLQCNVPGGTKDFVRILVNDVVQPLGFCGAGDDGLCELEAFVASQAYARGGGGGDWEKCGTVLQ
ncbi:phytase [Hygrophoropsis aurantiaca]|uniref:Phytase n=1 Tax=Hygrophoropsis aurantiaca TaxID=72124 RepID=A0ACB8A989_9AGAM|nr:phytase [Hygrophoropsis aurantiaca]